MKIEDVQKIISSLTDKELMTPGLLDEAVGHYQDLEEWEKFIHGAEILNEIILTWTVVGAVWLLVG